MRIVIVGATGPTGRELLKEGVTRGHAMTALARRPEALAGLLKVDVKQADVLRPNTLESIFDGQEAVVSVLGIPLSAARRPTNVFSQGTANVVNAMKRSGVARLICLSSLGVGDSRGDTGLVDRAFFYVMLRGAYHDKEAQERIVRESGLDWTIVRAARLTLGPRTGNIVANTTHQRVGSSIARADVAAFLLDQVGSDRFARAVVAVGSTK